MAAWMGERRMCPGALHAVPGGVWVVDDELPILAFVDGRDLSVTIIGDWFRKSVFREWAPRSPVCTVMAGDDADCWIASPDVRGVICFFPGGKSVFELPAPVKALASTGGACWALLDLPSLSDPREMPLWRLDRSDAMSFDVDFALYDLVAAKDGVVALGWRPSDLEDGGKSRFAVVRIDDKARAEVLAEIEQPHGWQLKFHSGEQRLWLEVDSNGFEWPGAHWIEPLEHSSQGWCRGGRVKMPHLARLALDDQENVAWAWVRAGDDIRDFDHPFTVLRRPLGSEAEGSYLLPGDVLPGSARGNRAWCVSVGKQPLLSGTSQRSLLRLSSSSGGDIEVADIAEWPDIASRIPDPCPPNGVDPDAWAEFHRADIQADLAQSSRSKDGGGTRPYIKGTEVESVSVAGMYPATECIIRFSLEARPGVPFGRRIRFFDDLGAPRGVGYEALLLKERIETGAIPPPGRDIPGSDGVVWI